MAEQLKYCPDCGKEIPISCFSRNKHKKDGLQNYCKKHKVARNAVTRRRKSARLAELEQRNSMLLTHNAELKRQLREYKKRYKIALTTMATLQARRRV
jgi:hypothetical protein